ncbi:unnamed protein product, partial [Discosporangium mesarthrocarpum]
LNLLRPSHTAAVSSLGTEYAKFFDDLADYMREELSKAMADPDMGLEDVHEINTYGVLEAITDSEEEYISLFGLSTDGAYGVQTPCVDFNFSVDYQAEIMGTQAREDL